MTLVLKMYRRLTSSINQIYADCTYPKVSDNNIWLSAKEGKGLDELVELIKDIYFR